MGCFSMNYEYILSALKNGIVPESGTRDFCLGRDTEIAEFERLLSETDQKEKSNVKFIKGEFGAGKSFFLKVIEEMAFEQNFVVSWVTLGNDVHFNKIDVVYRNIVNKLRCKTGTSLDHIIDRWITGLKMMAFEETSDPVKQNNLVKENLYSDLSNTREHANAFAVAIENYNRLMNEEDYKTAEYAKAWLRGDANIPFSEKRKFGVKGDVDKHNALNFLEALSVFVKSIGYSGLVVLFDEAESIMDIPRKDLRNTAYDYIRTMFDNCDLGKFHNSLFVFAGTPPLFDDSKKGIVSYTALHDRIKSMLDTDLTDVRRPIFELKGFTEEDLVEIAGKLMIMHEEAYGWNASEKISPVINDIVAIHTNNARLTGGRVTPRTFVRSFVSVLDTVQQNQTFFNDPNQILELFDEQESNLEDDIDDIFDDDW